MSIAAGIISAGAVNVAATSTEAINAIVSNATTADVEPEEGSKSFSAAAVLTENQILTHTDRENKVWTYTYTTDKYIDTAKNHYLHGTDADLTWWLAHAFLRLGDIPVAPV